MISYNLRIRGSRKVHSFGDFEVAVRVARQLTGYDAFSIPENNVSTLYCRDEPVATLEMIDDAPLARALSAA